MQPQTELRIIVDREKEFYTGILNNKKVIVNIKNLTNKEEKIMLENEKVSKLEQLNLLKGEYETRLEDLKTKDVSALIESKFAEVKEAIEKEIVDENNGAISKTEIMLEVINEEITKTEAIPVEIELADAVAEDDNLINDVETQEIQ